jgi:hypothetical protein
MPCCAVLCWLLQGQSKLCNVLFMRELNKRLQAEGAPVLTVACHPGAFGNPPGPLCCAEQGHQANQTRPSTDQLIMAGLTPSLQADTVGVGWRI